MTWAISASSYVCSFSPRFAALYFFLITKWYFFNYEISISIAVLLCCVSTGQGLFKELNERASASLRTRETHALTSMLLTTD
jgi:hypothetical protein